MGIYTLEREQWVPERLDEVFAFFSSAENLETITPPWLGFHILTPTPINMAPGTLIDYSLRVHGIPVHWKTEIQVWEPPHKFVDRQLKGPYKLWHHTHTFQAENGGTRLRDVVRYQLPFGPLGDLVNTLKVRRDVETIFAYRHKVIEQKFS